MDLIFAEVRAHETELKLSGRALRYGETTELVLGSRRVKERFEAGALGDLSKADVILNLQHRRDRALARTGGGGLELRQAGDEILMDAELSPTTWAQDTVQLVRSGILKSLSIEFRSLKQRWEGSTRIVEQAVLTAIGVVDRPAYDSTFVAARSKPWTDRETAMNSGNAVAELRRLGCL